eukprot:CAMPEP_0171093074 /NCGR_PEP_ID=MMETSP0766_2-20121228/38866_1 /TAXON_ID=439317 /ORGANISM="Gambierdiscus australes, Strain CAWD 149" /LENGTH=99 /DNA_ID=CAMNT_0011551459 /DNA_START=701 /DNA_END=998 /DNA_ORIENTATION=+
MQHEVVEEDASMGSRVCANLQCWGVGAPQHACNCHAFEELVPRVEDQVDRPQLHDQEVDVSGREELPGQPSPKLVKELAHEVLRIDSQLRASQLQPGYG